MRRYGGGMEFFMLKNCLSMKKAKYKGYLFEYSLFSGTASVDGEEHTCYSVHASVRGNGYFDEATVCDITSCRETAETIFRQIADGKVDPCTLSDVIEDMI